MQGLRSQVGVGATPFTQGPYIWDQVLSFGGSLSSGIVSATSSTAVQTSVDGYRLLGAYLNSTATTNTNSERAAYFRLWVSGIGGGGESLRAFTTINNVAGSSAHGAQISLNFGTSGSLTGEGIAVRATFQVPNASMSGGTFTACEGELWSDGASSSVTGVTEISCFRAVLSGNGTGIANVDAKAGLFAIDGNSIGAGNIIAAKSSAAVSHTARILINGAVYYIMLSNVQ
jgi:hypothetical protein